MKADPKLTHVANQWKHSSPFCCCRFDPKGRFVFAGAEDCSVQRFSVADGKKVSFNAHDSWVRSIVFSADGETVITGGYEGRLIWWPTAAEKPAPIRTVEAHQGWVRTVSVSPDGVLLATGGNDNLVKLWNLADGKLVRELSGHGSRVYSTLFHPSGEFLLSGELNGLVKQWEVKTGKMVREFDAKTLHSYNKGQQVHYGGVRSLAISPDGKYLACSGLHKATNPLGAVNEPLVELFEWESGKKKQSHIAAGVRGVAWRILYHPDSYLVCASGGSGGGFLLFWKPEQNKEFFKLKLPDTARDLDLHPDGLQLATAHYDRSIRISRMTAKPKPPAKK